MLTVLPNDTSFHKFLSNLHKLKSPTYGAFGAFNLLTGRILKER